MVYTAEADPLCYPGTSVLRNLQDLPDQDDLDQFETAMFLIRSEEDWPAGRLDYPHYLALHRHLFQDVYVWAGQPRNIRIGKGGNWFCYPEYIDGEMRRIFAGLAAEKFLTGLPREAFVPRAAHYLAEINAVHPFREGNGRTQLAFLDILMRQAGFELNPEPLERDRVINAMIDSFAGDEAPLSALIEELAADLPG